MTKRLLTALPVTQEQPVEVNSAVSVFKFIDRLVFKSSHYSGAESAPIQDPNFWVFNIWDPGHSSTTPPTPPTVTTRVRIEKICSSNRRFGVSHRVGSEHNNVYDESDNHRDDCHEHDHAINDQHSTVFIDNFDYSNK